MTSFAPLLLLYLTFLHGVKPESTTVNPEETTTGFYTTEDFSTGTTCSAAGNDSCGVGNVTTPSPPIIKVHNKQDEMGRAIRKYKLTTKTSCSCDLQRRFCDINCCCDKDCSYDDKLVFKTCDDAEDFVPDTKLCKYMQYIYQNRTLYEWEMTQNSLFCVVRSDMPQQYVSQEKTIIRNKKDVMEQKANDYNWPNFAHNEKVEHDYDLNFNYSHGDPIWIVKNNQMVKKLDLPNSFITQFCNIKSEVKFLVDSKTECVQNIKSNSEFNVLNYIGNVSVLAEPYLFSTNFTNGQECPKNVCIPLEVKICDATTNRCHNDTRKLSQLQPMCRDNSRNGQKSCINYVQTVSYTFRHNGTRGISKVSVSITLRNFILDLTANSDDLKQVFEVKFMWNNYTRNYSDYSSGNPGYMYGKPILIGDRVVERNSSLNVSSGVRVVLHAGERVERAWDDYAGNFFTLPASKRGKCALDNATNLPVEFGFNLLAKCVVDKVVRVREINEGLCGVVQREVLAFWSMDFAFELTRNKTFRVENNKTLEEFEFVRTMNRTVGKHGNSNQHKNADWEPVMFENTPQEVVNSTVGKLFDSNATLLCLNISTTMKVDFFHAREEHQQETIIASFVEFANPQRFQFKIINNNSLRVEIPIRSEVMFHDVTKKQVRKFPEPPSLDVKLPFDFFYPFMKVGNSGARPTTSLNYILVAFICLIVQGGFIE